MGISLDGSLALSLIFFRFTLFFLLEDDGFAGENIEVADYDEDPEDEVARRRAGWWHSRARSVSQTRGPSHDETRYLAWATGRGGGSRRG